MSQAARVAHWVPTYTPAIGQVVKTVAAPGANNVVDTDFGTAGTGPQGPQGPPGPMAPGTATPRMDGTAAVGVSATLASREDHVHPSDTSRVARTGDTMTGDLTISKTIASLFLNKPASGDTGVIYGSSAGLKRWSLEFGDSTAESGGNTGSNFSIGRWNDAGGFLAAPFIVDRAAGNITINTTTATTSSTTGALVVSGGAGIGGALNVGGVGTLGGNLFITKASPEFYINKSASGQLNLVRGTLNGAWRWAVDLGNGDPESGSNSGSNFAIYNYTDASGFIGVPLIINRATGNATFAAAVVVGAPTGGAKGNGTINATAVYDDNVLLTCVGVQYLKHGEVDLDQWDDLSPTGLHKTAHRFAELVKTFDPRNPKQYIARMMADEALPGMPTMDEWRHGETSLGELHNRLWLAVELLAAAFVGLHDDYEQQLAALTRRIDTLERIAS